MTGGSEHSVRNSAQNATGFGQTAALDVDDVNGGTHVVSATQRFEDDGSQNIEFGKKQSTKYQDKFKNINGGITKKKKN